jgi:hypothetical protein
MEIEPFPHPKSASWTVEILLAIVGVLICTVDCVWIWLLISDHQAMWPFPALYLLEAVVIALIGTIGIYRSQPGRASRGGLLIWIAAGTLFGFSFTGLFSIGPFYLPAALAFLVAAILSAWKSRAHWSDGILVGLLSAMTQSGLMLLIIPLLHS